MIFKIGATVPTVQYGNLMPEIEVEAPTFEEAQKIGLEQIQKLWNAVCEDGKELKIRGVQDGNRPTKAMPCKFTGQVLFLDDDHVYRDEEGNVYESGSKYAKKYSYPFDKDTILPFYAKKTGVEPQIIDGFWTSKADASTTFGHALHQAMETYGKYNELATNLEKPLGIHPLLMGVVEEFFDERQVDEDALYEVFVVDKDKKRCGQIDRLVKTGDKTCIIEDFKTNADIRKQGKPTNLKDPFGFLPNQPISEYTLQLNFYREILEALGLTVEGMRIHLLDKDGWTEISVDRVDLV